MWTCKGTNTCALFNQWLLRRSKISADSKSEVFLTDTAESLGQMKEKLRSFPEFPYVCWDLKIKREKENILG